MTNNSAIPRISIRALHADASPLIAEPEYVITRSNTGSSDLEVELTVTETEDYFVKTSYEWTIDTSETSYAYGTWPDSNRGRSNFNTSINSINTDGTVTLTVADSDDYLPALAPDNAATVDIKLPPTGPTVSVSHLLLAGTVTEGNSYDAPFVFTTGAGVATPRHDFRIRAFTAAGTAAINEDYSHTTRTLDIRVGDWVQIGNRYHNLQAKLTVPTVEDSFYEGDETFLVELRKVSGNDNFVVIPTGAERATVTIRDDEVLGVTEIKVTSTPSGGYYDVGETITFTLTFNGAVTVAGTPQFGFLIGDQTRQATYASGSGTVDLVFSHTVAAAYGDDPDGISWGGEFPQPARRRIDQVHAHGGEQADRRKSLSRGAGGGPGPEGRHGEAGPGSRGGGRCDADPDLQRGPGHHGPGQYRLHREGGRRDRDEPGCGVDCGQCRDADARLGSGTRPDRIGELRQARLQPDKGT